MDGFRRSIYAINYIQWFLRVGVFCLKSFPLKRPPPIFVSLNIVDTGSVSNLFELFPLENLLGFIIPSTTNNFFFFRSKFLPSQFFHNNFFCSGKLYTNSRKPPVLDPNPKGHIIKANIKILAPEDMENCMDLWPLGKGTGELECGQERKPVSFLFVFS